jgi:hypothetical protein
MYTHRATTLSDTCRHGPGPSITSHMPLGLLHISIIHFLCAFPIWLIERQCAQFLLLACLMLSLSALRLVSIDGSVEPHALSSIKPSPPRTPPL